VLGLKPREQEGKNASPDKKHQFGTRKQNLVFSILSTLGVKISAPTATKTSE